MMYTHEKLASELERVSEICTTTALAEAAKYGAELIRHDEWHPVTLTSPTEHFEVIVAYRDDSGDTPVDNTAVAWRHGDGWISDNDLVVGEVYAWKHMPYPPDYKSF